MKKMRVKDIFTLVCTISSIVSSVIIICTFLTQYQFVYVKQAFNSYLTLQASICVTMVLWGLRFFFYRKGRERLTYSGICLTISMILILFIVFKVT